MAVPWGKAATVVTSTPLSLSSRATMGRSEGRTHTETQWYSFARAQPSTSSAVVMSGLSREWSMVPAISLTVMESPS